MKGVEHMANNEMYRNDDSRYNWRCTWQERKRLKILAAEKGTTMNDILSRAFALYWKYDKRKNRVYSRRIKKVSLS